MFLVIAAAVLEPLMVDQLAAKSEYVGKTISVRGFAYQVEDALWVLAPEPQLRSCCLRKEGTQRVFFLSDLSTDNNGRALTIAGRLTIEDGQLKLEGARPVAPNPNTGFWISLATVTTVAILGSLVLRGRRPRPRSAR